VRLAEAGDLDEIVEAVAELLVELGATPPPKPAMREAALALLGDPAAGTLIVAEAAGALVGMLSASWQSAIHIPGRYGLIQDLWVRADWRRRALGAALLDVLIQQAAERGIARLEVGLPKEGFTGLDATVAFYSDRDFEALGPRMRRVIS
jgi:GNAT superfamily N-acetyltransferase